MRNNTLIQETEYSAVFSKRIPVNADRNQSFDSLRTQLELARKDVLTAKGSDLKLEQGHSAVEIEGKSVSFAPKGHTSFLRELRLDGLINSLGQIKEQTTAKRYLTELVEEVLKEKKTHNFRFHTVQDNNGATKIVHVTDTKHSVVKELDLFDQIREGCKELNFVPVRLDADFEKVKVQLVQIDDSFELDPIGMRAHQFVGGQKDKFWGMLTATLSETSAANEILLGIYNEICSNGAIIGAQDDVSMKAIRGAKTHFSQFLQTMFEICAGKAVQQRERLASLSEQAFTAGALKTLEVLLEKYTVRQPYNAFIKDDIEAIIGTGTKLDAYNVLTFGAHDERIPAEKQLRLESAAGQLLLMAN